ncbi:HugZ family pyridoxamine 5'-phosphate oxidase [Pelagibacterium mangrovi]|uniref:HugZ family pyridoxamine 5'-phosphate oxidase n=1 Tax=Pelagibacterium mangrovi TaxID=3119828 RepID=UPI002FC5869E
MAERESVFQEATEEIIRQVKTLIRTSRHGALAVLDPADGSPLASRVGVSTDIDGAPILLLSRLAAHTGALLADPRCSLLLGEEGKGDALAHPRISIKAVAREIERNSDDHKRLEGRYLSHQPKARLYANLPDFSFFRLEPSSASLNGGFGRAYILDAHQLLTISNANAELAATEQSAIEHMNEEHGDAVERYARFYAKAPAGRWTLLGIDAEGFEIGNGGDIRRIFFSIPLESARDVHLTLVAMSKEARAGLSVES